MLLLLFVLVQTEWTMKPLGDDASLRGIDTLGDTVWVCGTKGTVAFTTNEGLQWEHAFVFDSSDLDFRDIEVFKDHIVLMSAGVSAKSRIFRSEDSGETWTVTYEMRDTTGFLNAIAFWDTQNGVALSDPIDGTHFLLLTSDGGRSWQQIPAANIPLTLKGEYGFAASGTNIFVGFDSMMWIATGGTQARIFKSKDKGLNWDVFPSKIQQGGSSTGHFSIAFWDPQHGVVVGGDYQKPELVDNNALTTRDGGQSWQLSAEQPPYRSCVAYLPGQNGQALLAVGRSGTSFSNDGGQSWTTLNNEGFYTMSIKPNGQVWAAGAGGKIATLNLGD